MSATVKAGNARGRASRARLLEAAATCFGDRGYVATRIADITAEAGMSQAGFYRHFADKQAVLLELLADPLDALRAATGPLTESGPVSFDVLVERNTAFFRTYAAHRRVLRVLRELATLHDPGMDEVWLRARERFVDRIRRWLRTLEAEGGLATADVDVLADALGGVLDQLAFTRLGLARTEPTEAEIDVLGRVSAEIWAGALGVAREAA